MKTIFITGGAGAVGSAVALELMRDPSVRLVLLLRPAPGHSVQERLLQLHSFWKGAGVPESALERVEAVSGDAAEENLGLDAPVYESLADRITVIVHGAAQVKVNMSEEEARHSVVAPTLRILCLARLAPALEKLEYLSTVGVGGTMTDPMPEARIRTGREFHNTYESSKAEAEELVWDAIDQGLPVTIHRPSMVVGDSRDGRTVNFQVFYHLSEFLSGRATRGWVPRFPHFCLDVVPSDYVARAIAASTRNRKWAGRVLHLAGGQEDSWPLDQYVDRLPGLFNAGGLPARPVRRMPWLVFRALVPLLALFGPVQRRKAFRNLPRFLSYLGKQTYFETAETRRLLATNGIRLSPVQEFLPPVMAAYAAHRIAGGKR